MTNPRRQRFLIGLFVLLALGLLAWLTTLFGHFPDLFRKYNAYTVRFTDAPGVQRGTPVRLSGIRIGEVKRVELDKETGDVVVHIAVDKEYPIYDEDLATLATSPLGGETSIDFIRRPRAQKTQPEELVPPPRVPPEPPPPDPVPGAERPDPVPPQLAPAEAGEEESQAKPEERQPAKPGTEFQGVKQPDVATVLKAMAELVEPTQESLKLIRQSLQRLEKTAPLAEDTLREYRELARETRRTIPELRRSNDEINVAARNWGKLGERLDVLVQTNQDKVIKAVDNLNDALVRVNNVLSDENQKNLAATLRNARAGTQNLESISRNADELMKESRATIKRLNDSLTRADEVLNNLQQAAKPLAERSDSITKNLDESAVKLNQTLTEVRELLKTFSQGDGTLQKLLNDPGLYNHADDLICALRSLMPRVDRALRDLEVFADKLARHPESIGLGGAIRPSSGLKEAPSAPAPPAWPRR
jgi:ABC-type transporter Mla subunit MlaD